MVVVGRDLCTASGQISLLKQGHLEMAFEDLQGWRLYHLSREYVPGHPHEEVFPGVQFVPIASFPVTGHH